MGLRWGGQSGPEITAGDCCCCSSCSPPGGVTVGVQVVPSKLYSGPAVSGAVAHRVASGGVASG